MTHRMRTRAIRVVLTSVLVGVVAAGIAGCGGGGPDKYVGTWKVTTYNGKPYVSAVGPWIITIKKLGDKYEVSDTLWSGAETGTHVFTKEGETLGYSNFSQRVPFDSSAVSGNATVSVSGDTLTFIISSSPGVNVEAVRQ